jgi:hypothetical protein
MQTETRLNYDLQSYPTPRQFIGGEWRRGGDGSAGWVLTMHLPQPAKLLTHGAEHRQSNAVQS